MGFYCWIMLLDHVAGSEFSNALHDGVGDFLVDRLQPILVAGFGLGPQRLEVERFTHHHSEASPAWKPFVPPPSLEGAVKADRDNWGP